MELDNLERIQQLDTLNMLAEIDGLPDQLAHAYQMGTDARFLKETWHLKQVVIAGMGGSAIGADLLSAYVADVCPVPVIVHRDYGLPSFAHGEKTLVICSSHSGNTEETLELVRQPRAGTVVVCWRSAQAGNWPHEHNRKKSRSSHLNTRVSRAPRWAIPLGSCWRSLSASD